MYDTIKKSGAGMEEILMVKLENVIKIYDYHDAIADDVRELVKEREEDGSFKLSWYVHEQNGKHYFNREEAANELGNLAFNEDSVTGNSSGSYTMSTLVAERCLVGNLDLLDEALDNFGEDANKMWLSGPEWADVTVRCYLVDGAVSELLTEYMQKNGLEDLPTDDNDDLPM